MFELETLIAVYQEGARPWWDEFQDVLPPGLRRLIECEDNADKAYANSSSVIHGLIQTPEYVEGLFAFAEAEMGQLAAERLKAVRARRQQVLFRPHNPLALEWFVAEGALRYEVGGRAVMRRQLAHLLGLIEASVLKAHVVPFSSGTAASLCRDWTLLEFPDKAVPGILWSDERGGIRLQEDPKSLKFARLQRKFISGQVLTATASRDLITTIRKDM